MQTIYRPGQWYLIVIPGALVALPPDVPGEVVARLWDRLPADKTLAAVVDVLTTQAGGSFAALPPFAAAVAEGADVRIALRGGVAARVSGGADAAQEFSGAEVTTWSERFVAGATRVEITVEHTDAVTALPVQSGVVRAAAVSAELEASDAASLTDVLGPAPVLADSEDSAVSAAVLAEKSAPTLARFGTRAEEAPEAPAPLGAAGVPIDETPVGAAPVGEPPQDADPAASESAAPGAVETDQAPEGNAGVEAQADDAPAAESDAPEPEAPEPALADEGVTLVPTETLAPLSDEDEFDQLFGATVHSATGVAAPPPPAVVPVEGDHDGATISAAELRALRQQPPAPAPNDAPTQVLPVAHTAAGRIRISTGQVVSLDRTVIIGRRPRSTRASGENMPHLVAVESPQQDISRSHLEVRPEGDTVVVIDLHTTNGSTLLRPGADPVRLHPGEQTLVLSGDVVDLGDGVTLAFEDLP